MKNKDIQNEICESELKIGNVDDEMYEEKIDNVDMQNVICESKVGGVKMPYRPSKIRIYESWEEDEIEFLDLHIKTRIFRVIWNNVFILEIREDWLGIEGDHSYARKELLCMASGVNTVERIYESFIMISKDDDDDNDCDCDACNRGGHDDLEIINIDIDDIDLDKDDDGDNDGDIEINDIDDIDLDIDDDGDSNGDIEIIDIDDIDLDTDDDG